MKRLFHHWRHKIDIHNTAIVHRDVELGKESIVQAYVLLGILSNDHNGQVLETSIGENAIIRSHSVIYAGNEIGINFRTGHHAFVRSHNKIGNNASIGSRAEVGSYAVLEDDVRVHSNTCVSEYSLLKRGCWIGPNVMLANARYPMSHNSKRTLNGPAIEEGVIIGANAVILPGVTVGAYSVVGAGSVVTRNMPPNVIVAGNPARILRSVTEVGVYGSDQR